VFGIKRAANDANRAVTTAAAIAVCALIVGLVALVVAVAK